MTSYDDLVDAVGAVDRLLRARGPKLSAFSWRAVVAQLDRATDAARTLAATAALDEEDDEKAGRI